MTRKRIKKVPVLDMFGGIYGYSAPEKEISIVVCDKSQADAIIVPHHYSHKVTKNSFLSFLVYYKGKINGAMQLGYGIRPKIKKIGGGSENDTDTTREFDRMWLSDDMPKFSETITLSLLHHFLRKVHPEVKTLISYADTSAGHCRIGKWE